jgi:hypothetical protein
MNNVDTLLYNMLSYFNEYLPKQYKLIRDFQLVQPNDSKIEIRPSGIIVDFDYVVNKFVDVEGYIYERETVENNPDFFECINDVPLKKIICQDVSNFDNRSIIVTFDNNIDVKLIRNDIMIEIQKILDRIYNDINKNGDDK